MCTCMYVCVYICIYVFGKKRPSLWKLKKKTVEISFLSLNFYFYY